MFKHFVVLQNLYHWAPSKKCFWYHPLCCNHNLNHLLCMTLTLKHKSASGSEAALASKAVGIACRMVIAWSTSSLKRKWGGGLGRGELGQPLQSGAKERENIQWTTWDAPNLILSIYSVQCTTKEINLLAELEITISAGVIIPHTIFFLDTAFLWWILWDPFPGQCSKICKIKFIRFQRKQLYWNSHQSIKETKFVIQ